MTYRFDWDRFYNELNAERKHQELSWRQLGKFVGIPACTFTRLKQGRTISTPHSAFLCEFMEKDIRIFLIETEED